MTAFFSALFSQIYTWINTVWTLGNIGVSCFPFVKKHILKKDVRYLLKMNENPIYVIWPLRRGKLDDSSSTALEWTYVTLDEALALNELQKLTKDLRGPKYEMPSPTATRINRESSDNLICIGGPMVNEEVANYFRKQLPNVKFKWTNKNDVARIEKFQDFIFLADADPEYGLADNEIRLINQDNGKDDIVFNYDSKRGGYVFLIRLTGVDFNNSENGTVHILFGNDAACTLAAVKVLNKQRKALIKRLKAKKRNGHYAVLIKCHKNGDHAVVDFNQFFDYTDECFTNSK